MWARTHIRRQTTQTYLTTQEAEVVSVLQNGSGKIGSVRINERKLEELEEAGRKQGRLIQSCINFLSFSFLEELEKKGVMQWRLHSLCEKANNVAQSLA